MAGPASEMQGQFSRLSMSTPINLGMDARRVTRGMNGVYKRKRPEIKRSDSEIIESNNLKYLGNNNKVINSLGKIIILIKALKKIIKQQNNTIKSI